MKHLIENDKVQGDFNYYRKAFAKMNVDFRPGKFTYKSSHWRDLGTKLYEDCFDS